VADKIALMSSPGASRKLGIRFDFAEAILGIACGLAFTTAFAYCIQIPLHPVGTRDYIVYWATGKLLLHHANPYNPTLIGILEHSAGLTVPGSYYMRNPPWGLPLALLPALFGARAAAVLWTLMLLGVLLVAVRAVWPAVGVPNNRLALLGYLFPPALNCVISGQTSLFLLLGLALFLRLHKSRPFWAGASVWFWTLKPHVLLPFALVWLAWVLLTRAWRMLAGSVAAMAVSCLLTECLDPRAWMQYLHWSRNSGITNQKIPCLGVALRQLIHPASFWITFIPLLVGSAWALFWFARHRRHWNWIEHGSALVLVSIFVAPYCWIWDHSVAIPALLFAVCRTTSRWPLTLLALAYIVIDLQEIFGVAPHSWLYLWPGFFWLAWYLLARARATPSPAAWPAENNPVLPALG
jgi:hypothetical protein